MARDTETNRTGWRSFQKRCHRPEAQLIIDEMTSLIAFQAKRDLATVGVSELAFLGIGEVRDLEAKVLQPTLLKVRDDFGLTLRFTLDRDASKEEIAMAETTGFRLKSYVEESKADIQSVQTQMKLLRGKLEQSADLMPEEREELQEKLRNLKTALLEQTGEIEKPRLSTPKQRKTSSLDDYLLPEDHKPQKKLSQGLGKKPNDEA